MGKKDNRAQELEVINTAFFLEGTLVELRKDKQQLDDSKPIKPSSPIRPTLRVPDAPKEDYPNIPTPDVPFPSVWKIAAIGSAIASVVVALLCSRSGNFTMIVPALIALVAIFAGPIVCYCIGNNIRAEKINRLVEARANSSEYKAQCQQIDQRNAMRQKQAEEQARKQFALATQEYERKLLPKFEEQAELYKTEILPEYQAEQTALQEAIDAAEAALQEVYDRNILPGKYRNLAAVTFLAAFMGTSQYDLKFSIERYDKDIDHLLAKANGAEQEAQRALLGQILQEQQYSNYLNEQTQDILADSNDVLRETRNWTAANTAMHAYDIQQRKKREKEAKKRH